jgi:hypothetical protein
MACKHVHAGIGTNAVKLPGCNVVVVKPIVISCTKPDISAAISVGRKIK